MGDDLEIGQTFDGGCACGAIRYRMLSAPMYVHCCHCRWCQRESGSAFALNAFIEADRLILLQGEPQRVVTPSESGDGQVFFRCPECRIALWSNYSIAVGDRVRFVRVGTLDEAHRISPDIHIYTRSKQPWFPLPSDVPVFDEYYDRRLVWPEESLRRFNALREQTE